MTDPIDTNVSASDFEHESGATRQVIIEKHVHTQVQEPKSSVPAFIAGFLTAGLLAATAAIVILAVSDRDDDGNLQLDVPSVDVDISE